MPDYATTVSDSLCGLGVAGPLSAYMTETFLTGGPGAYTYKSVFSYIPQNLWPGIMAGTNTTDVTTYVQAALDAWGATGGSLAFPGIGPYLISDTLVFKQQRSNDAVNAHFRNYTFGRIYTDSGAIIQADGDLAAMLEIIFNTTLSVVAPFYTVVEGLMFDANGHTVDTAIKSDYAMHLTFERCRFLDTVIGVDYVGYGVFYARGCYGRNKYMFHGEGGGGDSILLGNGWEPTEATAAFAYHQYYFGNIWSSGNTLTNEGEYATVYGHLMDGASASGSEEIRDVVIGPANEFSGLAAAVKATGKATGTRNIWRCQIKDHPVTQFGTTNPGCLFDGQYCSNIEISGNQVGSRKHNEASGTAVSAVLCDGLRIHDNTIENFTERALFFNGCTDTDVYWNKLYDIGKAATNRTFVYVTGSGSANVTFRNNLYEQSVAATYANGGIFTDAGDYTFAYGETFRNVGNPYTLTGANSVMIEEDYGAAAPVSGTHLVGAKRWNSAPAAAGTIGWVCTTGGSPGTWKEWGTIAS